MIIFKLNYSNRLVFKFNTHVDLNLDYFISMCMVLVYIFPNENLNVMRNMIGNNFLAQCL